MKGFINIEELKEYLKNNDVNKLDDENRNILFYQFNIDVVNFLIDNTKININQLDKYKQNILFCNNDLNIIKCIIEKTDINVNQLNYKGDNILSFYKNFETFIYIIENTNIEYEFINDIFLFGYNCENLSFEQKKYLIDKKYIDVKKINFLGRNILFYEKDINLIKYLIGNTDININQVDNEKLNLLHYNKYNLDIIKYLIDKVDIKLIDDYIKYHDYYVEECEYYEDKCDIEKYYECYNYVIDYLNKK